MSSWKLVDHPSRAFACVFISDICRLCAACEGGSVELYHVVEWEEETDLNFVPFISFGGSTTHQQQI